MNDELADLSGESRPPDDFSTSAVRPPQPPARPHEPSKRSGCRPGLAIIIIFISIVALIGGCVAFVTFAVKGAVDETNRFVALLDEGRFDEAAATVAPSCQARSTATTLSELFDGEITDYRFSSSSVNTSDGLTTGEVTGTISVDGVARTASARLIKSGDEWQVCVLELG